MPYTQNAGLACIGTVTVPAAALPVLACITITTYYFYYYYYVPRPCSTCSRWLHLRLASRVVWGRARDHKLEGAGARLAGTPRRDGTARVAILGGSVRAAAINII